MNQPQEARRAAAQAFYESLEQLQHSLESAADTFENAVTHAQPPTAIEVTAGEISLDAWEEAIADIDQFMQDIAAQEQ